MVIEKTLIGSLISWTKLILATKINCRFFDHCYGKYLRDGKKEKLNNNNSQFPSPTEIIFGTRIPLETVILPKKLYTKH